MQSSKTLERHLLLCRYSDVLWDSKAGVIPGLRLAGVAAVPVAVAGAGLAGAGDHRGPVAHPEDPTMHPGSKIIGSSSNSSQILEDQS